MSDFPSVPISDEEMPLQKAQRILTKIAEMKRELNEIAPLPIVIVMTPERIEALRIMLNFDNAPVMDRVKAKRAVRMMLDEVCPEGSHP